jgi:hypothetical protein
MEIIEQRLDPCDVIAVDKPDLSYDEDWLEKEEDHECNLKKVDDRLFASCIKRRCNFHIDPYGKMTFCSFIKDPKLRCDLRQKSFKECWEDFIPSLADKIKGGGEYLENCGSCDLRSECRWCPVYGYLEHRRFSAKVEYLCSVAREQKRFKEDWQRNHRRYYQIGGITIQLDSDLPVTDKTFHPKFELFRVSRPGEDNIAIRHHFTQPYLKNMSLGQEIYRKPPWAIYKKGNSWIYLSITPDEEVMDSHQVTVFNHDYTKARIYNKQEDIFRKGNLHSLTLFPTDQILLAQVLAQREGCYLHSSGIVLKDKGLLFVGHSDAGKTTIATMLKDKAEVLCDDRIIVRKIAESFKIYGTWSHGDLTDVSQSSAPLSGILFLEQASDNRIIIINNRKEKIKKLLACLIRPLESADWWNKMLSLVETISLKVPCYSLQFDKSGRVVDLLNKL